MYNQKQQYVNNKSPFKKVSHLPTIYFITILEYRIHNYKFTLKSHFVLICNSAK